MKTALATLPPPDSIDYLLRLEMADGEMLDIPISFDFSDMTPEQLQWVNKIIPSLPKKPFSIHLAAACMFAKLDRPEEEWEVIGPVLIDAIDPKGSEIGVI